MCSTVERLDNPWKSTKNPLSIMVVAYVEQLAWDAWEAAKRDLQLVVPDPLYMRTWMLKYGPAELNQGEWKHLIDPAIQGVMDEVEEVEEV